MGAPRILALVRSCKECPRRLYYSGGRYECTAVEQILEPGKEHDIPDWCPLAPYPLPRPTP